MGAAVIFSGGPLADPGDPWRGMPAQLRGALDAARPELVVAADSGLDLAVSLGWQVDLVVGDMDSVRPDTLDAAVAAGAALQRHDADKDATDLELAIETALRAGVDRVLVIGSPAGRLDHLLGGALLLASPRFVSLEIDAWLGAARVLPVHTSRRLDGPTGSVVSLSAVHGPAEGVRTEGLRWPLVGERLEPGSSRGISNELVDTSAFVEVASGTLLAVMPAPDVRTAPEGDRP